MPRRIGSPWDHLRQIFYGCQRMAKCRTKWRITIAEIFNHERYGRQMIDRQTDGQTTGGRATA